MIVPMKKVSLIVLKHEKETALKKLRKLGLLHIAITEGSGAHLTELTEAVTKLEAGIAAISELVTDTTVMKEACVDEALAAADRISALSEEKKLCRGEITALSNELARLASWGEIDTEALDALRARGVALTLCEMPVTAFEALGDDVQTVVLEKDKNTVRLAAVTNGVSTSDDKNSLSLLSKYRLKLPEMPSAALKQKLAQAEEHASALDEEYKACASYADSMKRAVGKLQKDIEYETVSTGMEGASLSEKTEKTYDIVYFTGYLPAKDLDTLTAAAKENAWGLWADDPGADDDVPTKLENNKFVSLIYPLTDFLGTVPGYFEYDISAWFLGFILVFFGIIFGDGGYGLLICAVSGLLIGKAYFAKQPIVPAYLLIMLMGAATIVWGTLTCTWFGIAPEHLPGWLQSISVPVISNVYADKLWYPPWTNGAAALTTTQNVQIVCFVLALVQLSAAHLKALVRNRRSLKLIGDLGSVLQLIGIFYVVLSLVVNGEVFGLGLVLGGIPVGTVSIVLVAIGFVMSFVFANYEGSIGESVLTSLKNIVSCLLGVVNMFSDIVSYIRLWAVGLAGSAISATVNDLAGPFLGNLAFMIVAIILLVFGHGLNMILNVLSVIVHGVRLNTLEFSSHLDMSWSGHKYKPFEE